MQEEGTQSFLNTTAGGTANYETFQVLIVFSQMVRAKQPRFLITRLTFGLVQCVLVIPHPRTNLASGVSVPLGSHNAGLTSVQASLLGLLAKIKV